MSVKIRLNPPDVIKKRLGIDANGDVQKFFTHTCRVRMDKYVPMDTGALAINNVREEAKQIIYGSPYAHYQYEGKVMGPNVPITRDMGNEEVIIGFYSPIKPKYYTGQSIKYNKDKHSKAGPYWDKRMWSAEKESIIREVKNHIKKR